MSETTEKTDEELVFAMAGGDREALGKLYDRHHESVTAVARRYGINNGRLEELVHDVFIEIWGAAGEFDPSRASVRTWLLVRARSRALDRKRKGSRRQELLEQSGDVLHPSDPSVDQTKSVAHRQIREAVARLDEELRQIVDLAYFAGESTRSIAESLGIPRGTVKSRMRRAREALATLLSDPSPGGEA